MSRLVLTKYYTKSIVWSEPMSQTKSRKGGSSRRHAPIARQHPQHRRLVM